MCSLSILFGGLVGVFGTAFIYMAAGFGIPAFPNMQTFDIVVISACLVGMVALEGLLLWVSAKGAFNYCPAIFSSQTMEPQSTE